MVCRALANYKVGVLYEMKDKLNHTGYLSILQHHTIPSGTFLVAQGFVLMQDNDPKHTSTLCRRYIKIKEEHHVLPMVCSLVKSADWNPIELVCDELDQKVKARQPINAVYFWQLLQESWAELSSVYSQSLFERMSRICESMIAAIRGPLDEWKDWQVFFCFFKK